MNSGEHKFLNSERWINLLAIVASMGSLFMIIYQTNLTRTQQYASVMPYLELWNNSNFGPGSYELALVNNGIGPAFIESITVSYKDSTYKLDPANFLEQVVGMDTSASYSYASVKKGRVVPAGQKITLIGVKDSEKNSKILKKWFANDTEVEVIYRSIYGERWAVRGVMHEPVKLE